MKYPGGIIFVNSNISSQVLETIQKQLFIHQTIDFNAFVDGYSDYKYLTTSNNERVLVLIEDFTNVDKREIADVVIYVSSGLAYILKNNFGPPGLTLQVDKFYIHKLLMETGKDI